MPWMTDARKRQITETVSYPKIYAGWWVFPHFPVGTSLACDWFSGLVQIIVTSYRSANWAITTAQLAMMLNYIRVLYRISDEEPKKKISVTKLLKTDTEDSWLLFLRSAGVTCCHRYACCMLVVDKTCSVWTECRENIGLASLRGEYDVYRS